jgi:isocitrate/isopropylmalate dehydrogenase
MLRSTVLLLEHGLARPEEAQVLNRAIETALVSSPTADLGGTATTAEFGAAVREQLAVDATASSPYRGT